MATATATRDFYYPSWTTATTFWNLRALLQSLNALHLFPAGNELVFFLINHEVLSFYDRGLVKDPPKPTPDEGRDLNRQFLRLSFC